MFMRKGWCWWPDASFNDLKPVIEWVGGFERSFHTNQNQIALKINLLAQRFISVVLPVLLFAMFLTDLWSGPSVTATPPPSSSGPMFLKCIIVNARDGHKSKSDL